MRLSLRFLIPLLLVLGIIGYAVVPLVDSLMTQWAINDLDLRAQVIGSAVDNSLFDVIDDNRTLTTKKVKALFDRVMQDERLYALGFCDKPEILPAYKTERFPEDLLCPAAASGSVKLPSTVAELPKGPVHVGYYPIQGSGTLLGQLVLIHDMSFVATRSASTARYIMYLFIVLGIVIAFITVVIAQLSWRGWVFGMRALLRGEGLVRPMIPVTHHSELQPVADELRDLLRGMSQGGSSVDASQIAWTPETLKTLLKRDFVGDEVLVVSHREPYIHNRVGNDITMRKPATGVITALEPVMRACAGTWIALGSGTADRETVDEDDHIAVPPESPAYTLRRVWLTPEEEKAHHSLATEGFYTLCLVAHVRPVFNPDYWEHYQEVNRKFADAVVSEAKTKDPIIFVQDYHFALLPRMLRERLPNATIITFWHIPWPNPESFSICPWAEEILDGLLGSSILGFHTKYHCHNFFAGIERFLECRTDLEQSTVSYRHSLTTVNAYPISIDYLLPASRQTVSEAALSIRKQYNIPAGAAIGLGVDRLDYTKGISEKFLAVDRFFELHPEWIGRFTFVQVAAPTRAYFDEYKKTEEKMIEIAEQVNKKFGTDDWMPIVLILEYKSQETLDDFYRASDLCFIGSLHDGMNLVAKEYVAARDDEDGVLLLSQFTGATRELSEALIVNPYHSDQCASALFLALTMPAIERKHRMRTMRSIVRDFNVYRWAGKMLLDAARMRRRNRFVEQASSQDTKM